jgi:hypothetical protein
VVRALGIEPTQERGSEGARVAEGVAGGSGFVQWKEGAIPAGRCGRARQDFGRQGGGELTNLVESLSSVVPTENACDRVLKIPMIDLLSLRKNEVALSAEYYGE